MSHGKAVARNAMSLMLATVAQKAIAFLTFTMVARLAGVEVTGQFFFAISVTSVFVILSDLGLTPVVIREMAGDDTRGRMMLARAIRAKAFLIPLAVFASLGYGLWRAHDPQTLLAIALACFVMSADAVSLLWYGTLRGRRQLRFEALGMFVGQALTACVSILSVVVFYAGAPGLVVGLLVGSAWNVGWSVWQARRQGIYAEKAPSISWSELFRFALPFALAGVFVKIYSYVDTLVLQEIHGAVAVGFYSVAYKVTYALQFLPLTFVAALYPGMSAAYASKDRVGLERMLEGSLRLMLMIAVPATAILSSLASGYIPLIYGEAYRGSIAPMQILPWVLIPIFLDFPIGSLLNASHRAALKTTAMGVAMVINVILNFLLIPSLGTVGATIAALGSFWMLLFIGLWFVRKDITNKREVGWMFLKGMFVAVVLSFILRYLINMTSFLTVLILAPFIGAMLLLVTRLLVWQDVRLVIGWMRRQSVPAKTSEAHEE